MPFSFLLQKLAQASFLSVCSLLLLSCEQTSKPDTETIATQPAVTTPNYLTRNIKDEVFYFVMPDRFQNGDKSNDLGDKKYPESYGGFDPSHDGMYHGGDLAGLKDKLPYLKDMGVTAIWMTPIMRNQAMQADSAGYHGYWVLDFTQIDPHLGSNAELKSLIDAAHQLNMKVFFDIITNHSADVIKYKECHGDDGKGWLVEGNSCPFISKADTAVGKGYTAFIPEGNETLKTPAWLNNIDYYHNQGDSFWQGESSVYGDFSGLDDIDTDNPVVVNGMIDIFKDIVSEFKPDGFRIDTVKHVNIEFWQQFSPAIVAHAKSIGIPQFFMFGEVYDHNSENLSKFTTEGKLQSVLDFALQDAIHKVLISQQPTQVLADLFAQDKFYFDEDSTANELLTFIGNHDMGRFAYYVGSNKDIHYSLDEQLTRTKLAHAMLYFLRGVPVIYYGSEQGFTGDGGDRKAREDMMPSKTAMYNDNILLGTSKTTANDNFDPSHPLYQAFKQYAGLYSAHKALRQGQQKVEFAEQQAGIFAISRELAGHEKYYVVFNTATKVKHWQLPKGNYQIVSGKLNQGEAVLAPLSFGIYRQTN